MIERVQMSAVLHRTAAQPATTFGRAWRWLSLLLLTCCGLLLSACGGGSGSSGGEPAAVVPPAVPITISAQPSDQSVTVGGAATFSVTAAGGTLSYQWQSSTDGSTWVAVSGATSSSLSLPAVALTSNGSRYRVEISNGGSNATSSGALLTVTDIVRLPAITVQPEPVRISEGSSATFSVTAAGTSITYRWERSTTPGTWAAVPGATTDTLVLSGLTVADDGSLVRVVLSNSAGAVNSAEASLNVTAAVTLPTFTAQPASTTVVLPTAATFTATAVANPVPTLQWQLSTNNGGSYVDISGANTNSYTTGATTLAMSGHRYRVVATNSSGATPSVAAVLTVSNGQAAPSITTAPANATVTASQSATFTAVVSGSPTPSYQWQLSTNGGVNFANISGARETSYTLTGITLAQNGYRFRVVATNTAGAATSPAAVLTVNPPVSVLSNRAWSAGQLLEQGDQEVVDRRQGIDDAGRATVVFAKADGTRNVLYATRGTPGTAPAAPAWTTPVALDTTATALSTSEVFGLHVAPGGNALAYWLNRSACSASTYDTSGSCNYLYITRFLVASGSWESPTLVGSFPGLSGYQLQINDRGDVAGRVPGWVRVGTNRFTTHDALIWRANGATGFGTRVFSDVDLTDTPLFGMDAGGNFLLAAQARQNATTDLVVYRGSVSAGVGAQQILDNRGSAASLRAAAAGLNGQQVVVWVQNNGTNTAVFAATSSSPTAPFSLQDLGDNELFGGIVATVDDTGNALLVNRSGGWQARWISGTWQAVRALPSGVPTSVSLGCSHARNGNFMCVGNDFDGGTAGRWRTYDASLDAMIQLVASASPGPGYVLGVNTVNQGLGYSDPVLSIGGHAIITMRNGYDILPSPSLPNGDARRIINLWGVYFR